MCGTCGAFLGSAAPTQLPGGSLHSPFGEGIVETERTDNRLPASAQGGGRIAERYELIAILGTGGTGVVYRARDLELGEEVAIKILPPVKEGASDIARLKREIIAARKITHPNVIRLHDFGLSAKEGYLSMEILPGGTLADRLAAGVLPIDEALRIAIGVCDGLAAAHAESIIHRDIKPQNVLFDKAGRPKIVDFGLARGTEVTSNTVGFSGTPQYMSPESAEGNEITVKSDVYSLGVMLFEMFVGRRPFLAPSLGRLVTMHTKEAPPQPRSLRPDLPTEVEEVILRALEKSPAKRTQGCAEIAAVLRRVQGTIAPLDAAAEARSRESAASLGRTRVSEAPPLTLVRGKLPLARSRGLVLGAAAGVVLVGTAGVLGVVQPWRARDGAASPTPFAIASATPAATAEVVATPTPVAMNPTPSPAPTRTVASVATPPPPVRTPTPTPVPVARKGSLLVKSTGTWVKVVVDGKTIDESTPMPSAGVKLPAGKHTLVLTNKAASFSQTLTIDVKPDKLLVVEAEPLAGRVRIAK